LGLARTTAGNEASSLGPTGAGKDYERREGVGTGGN